MTTMRSSIHQNTDRRSFLKSAALGALAMGLPKVPDFMQGQKMGIVVHSYGRRWQSKTASARFPAFKDAVDLMTHCHSIGAGGIQVVVRDWPEDFVLKVRTHREKLGLYLEGSISLPKTDQDIPAFEHNVQAAKEAGASVLRTVSLGPRRYEALHSYPEFLAFQENALQALKWAEPVLKKHQMKLAIENHKDWRSDELVTLLQQLDSEWLGVTLDFGNSLALLEDPIYTAEKLAPFIFSTHVKDMGLGTYDRGFLLSEVPLGQGMVDLNSIISICKNHRPDVTFNLEMITRNPLQIPCLTHEYWHTYEKSAGVELAPILKMVRENLSELPYIDQLDEEGLLAEEENNVLLSLAYGKKNLYL